MEEACQELAEEIATALVERRFRRAWSYFAPWIHQDASVEDLREQIEEQLRDMADVAGCDEPEHPGSCRIEPTDLTFAQLRKPRSFEHPRSFPPEVNQDNFRQWLCLQFLPAADSEAGIDAWFDLWIVAVENEGEIQVGYYELREPD